MRTPTSAGSRASAGVDRAAPGRAVRDNGEGEAGSLRPFT